MGLGPWRLKGIDEVGVMCDKWELKGWVGPID